MNQHLDAIRIGKQYARVMIPCEACGGTRFTELQRRGRIAEPGVYGELVVVVCENCGFKMTNPRYEDRFYQDYYERLYREIAFGAEKPSPAYVETQKLRGAGVLRYAQRFIDRPGRMLDHGCASAATSLPWRDAGWDVKGMDPHRPSIELGRAEFGLDLTVAPGEALPYPDASFEIVVSLGSLEHVYDLAAAMREVRRVLVPGGWLQIRWRTDEMFGSPLEYYNHNHYRFLSANTWRLVLRRYGFEAVDFDDTKYEGYPNYCYIMARSSLPPSEAAVAALIADGVRDDPTAIKARLAVYRAAYRQRAEKFLALEREFAGDPAGLVDAIRARGIPSILMPGEPAKMVARGKLEAERYIDEFDSGRVA
ncbi:MAG: class I SAM-dependent methyltransferase [Alphaproteobacteria bacterium]